MSLFRYTFIGLLIFVWMQAPWSVALFLTFIVLRLEVDGVLSKQNQKAIDDLWNSTNAQWLRDRQKERDDQQRQAPWVRK